MADLANVCSTDDKGFTPTMYARYSYKLTKDSTAEKQARYAKRFSQKSRCTCPVNMKTKMLKFTSS